MVSWARTNQANIFLLGRLAQEKVVTLDEAKAIKRRRRKARYGRMPHVQTRRSPVQPDQDESNQRKMANIRKHNRNLLVHNVILSSRRFGILTHVSAHFRRDCLAGTKIFSVAPGSPSPLLFYVRSYTNHPLHCCLYSMCWKAQQAT